MALIRMNLIVRRCLGQIHAREAATRMEERVLKTQTDTFNSSDGPDAQKIRRESLVCQ